MRRWRVRPQLQVCAQGLRREQTTAEQVLWEHVRDRQLNGVKFRRQHPIGRFIVDFYCPSRRLVVEVDGSVHEDDAQQAYDQERTAQLESWGYRVIRWTNEQIETDLTAVLDELRIAIS